jgi:hypothetical protein
MNHLRPGLRRVLNMPFDMRGTMLTGDASSRKCERIHALDEAHHAQSDRRLFKFSNIA